MRKLESFYANILKMFMGTTGAYVFWALAMLVVGRLYDPEYFGGGQLFVSAASILSIVATGRYETALTIPRFRFQALQLLLFSAFLSLVWATVLFFLLLIVRGPLAEGLGILTGNLLLIPFYLLELCFYVLSYGWIVRTENYATAARGLIIFPLSYLAFCVVFRDSSLPIHKLILAVILARGLEVMYYGRYLYKDLKVFASRFSFWGILRQGRAYADFPKYVLAGSFVDSVAVYVVPFLITAFWGLEATGYYSMAMQILAAPAGLIAKAVGDVFRQEGAKLYGKYKECEHFYSKNLRICASYAVFVCICAYVVVPVLLPVVLGEPWCIAGQYVRWLLPMTCMTLLASPLSNMYIIARKQKKYLWIQIMAFLVAIIGIGGVGWRNGEIEKALLFWGGLSMAVWAVSIYEGWQIAKGSSV